MPKESTPAKSKTPARELQRRAQEARRRAELAKQEARDAKRRAREARALFKEAKKVAKKARAELAALSKKLKKLLGPQHPVRKAVKAKRKRQSESG